MLNTTKAFIMSLFELFLIYIVFANFVGWSGSYLNVTGYNYDWSNSYIGFQSLNTLVADFGEWIEGMKIDGRSVVNMQTFIDQVARLLNAMTLGIPKLIVGITNNNFNFLLIGEFLFNFFASPLLVFAYSCTSIGIVLYWILGIIGCFLKFCGGAYNVQFHDTDDLWNQWSSVVDEWNWSLLQVPIM